MNEKNIENKDFFSPSNLTVLDNNADLENSVENIEVALNEEIQNPLPDFDISDTFNQKSPEVVSVSFRPYTPYQNIKDFSPLHDVIFKQQIFPDFLFNPELTHDQEIPLDFMSRNEIAELFKYAAEKLISLDVTPDDIFDILESTFQKINTAPTAVDNTATVAEDGTLIISIATLLSNDSDIDGDALLAANFSLVGSSNGSVSVQDGNVIFTPNANYNGPASFTYQIADGQGGTDTATTNITVTPEVVHQNSYVFLSKGLSGGYTRDNWTTDAGTGAVASSASGAGTVAKYYNLENATDLNAYNQADQSGHKPLSAATCTLKDTEYNANTDTLTVRIDDNDSSKIKNIEIGMDYDTVDNLNIRAFEDVLIKFLESDNPGQHAGQDSNIYVRDATRLDVDLTKALGDVGLTLETKGTPNSINAHANIEGSSHDDYFTVSDNGSLDNHFTIQFNANDGADRLIIEPGFLTSLNVDMGSGNDAIFMESATGTLHGGSGTDILYLSEDAGHYNITNNNNGTYTITGESGMNMIYDSIEQIVYSANMNNIANAGG